MRRTDTYRAARRNLYRHSDGGINYWRKGPWYGAKKKVWRWVMELQKDKTWKKVFREVERVTAGHVSLYHSLQRA